MAISAESSTYGNAGSRARITRSSRVCLLDMCVAALFACTTGCLTFWSTIRGISLTPDSAQYLSAAENLSAGNGLVLWDGTELTAFPPGYSLLIRLGMSFGWTSDTSARMIGVVSSALIVFATGCLAASSTRRRIAAPVALLTAVCPYVLYLSTWNYSEPVFTVALLITAMGLVSFVQGAGRPQRALLVMVIGSWACCLLRYVGYGVVIACVAAIVFTRASGRDRLVHASTYVAGAAIAPIGIIAHNVWRSGGVGRPGIGPRDDVWTNIIDSVRAVGRWTGVRPSWATWLGDGLLGLVLLVLGAGVTIVTICRRPARRESASSRALAILIVTLVIVTWVSARLVWVSVDQRMLFPLLPLSIALVSACVVSLVDPRTNRRRMVLSLAYVLVISLLATRLEQASHFAHDQPQGFGSAEWRESQVIATIGSLSPGTTVYSNRPSAVWVLTRRSGIRDIEVLAQNVEESDSSYGKRLNGIACTLPFVAWFESSTRVDPRVLDGVRRHVSYRGHVSSDGAAGFVLPSTGASCASETIEQ